MKKIGSLINYLAPFFLIIISELKNKGVLSSKTHIVLTILITVATIISFIVSIVLELRSKSEVQNKKLIIYSLMLAILFLIILFCLHK